MSLKGSLINCLFWLFLNWISLSCNYSYCRNLTIIRLHRKQGFITKHQFQLIIAASHFFLQPTFHHCVPNIQKPKIKGLFCTFYTGKLEQGNHSPTHTDQQCASYQLWGGDGVGSCSGLLDQRKRSHARKGWRAHRTQDSELKPPTCGHTAPPPGASTSCATEPQA